MNVQVIYFDSSDDEMDGKGWNLVVPGYTVAFRYPSLHAVLNVVRGTNFVIVGNTVPLAHAAQAITDLAAELGAV